MNVAKKGRFSDRPFSAGYCKSLIASGCGPQKHAMQPFTGIPDYRLPLRFRPRGLKLFAREERPPFPPPKPFGAAMLE